MAATVQSKREKSEVTPKRSLNNSTVPMKKLEEQNKVKQLEKSTKAQQKIDHLTLLKKKNYELENAQLQEENAILRKKLGEQNNNVVELEELTQSLQNAINVKNSKIDRMERQSYIGTRIGIIVNALVESVKKGIDINGIYGVGPVTLSIFGFHHVVHFANLNEIELKPLEIEYVNELFTLLLRCKEMEVHDNLWKPIITTTVISISRSTPAVTVAAIQNFFERTVNFDACVQVMRGITDWSVYFNLTASKIATVTNETPVEPIFVVKQQGWEFHYQSFDYLFNRGVVLCDGFHPVVDLSGVVMGKIVRESLRDFQETLRGFEQDQQMRVRKIVNNQTNARKTYRYFFVVAFSDRKSCQNIFGL
ncbi:hypothetical protein BC833DRAFT_570140 [Globomyces pollinis-pini]|nr:hypothetical protein BC833DRAFT_570140 [Globomyces pollinis-pini]